MSEIDFKKLQGWPFLWFGLIASGLYILVVTLVIGESLLSLSALKANEIGDTLAGIFAPLALIWLIVGILQQGRELRIQVQDLKESVEAQKALAKASGGQERLQNEQFLERLYRLYKSACLDVLYQLLSHEILQANVRYGEHLVQEPVLAFDVIDDLQRQFRSGNRVAILQLARAVIENLNDPRVNHGHFDFVCDEVLERTHSLATDFLKFDALRQDVLSKFEGGVALGRVDSHEGFDAAQFLAQSYADLAPLSA